MALAAAVAGMAVAQRAGSASASLPKVAVYAADHSAEMADVVAKLTASGLYSQVDNLSPVGCGSDPSPTLSTLEQYAAVLVWSDCNFNDGTALGNVLADYVDAGHRVVVATHGFLAGGSAIGGRLVSGGYLPLTIGGFASGVQEFLAADLPSHPLLAGVSSFDGNTFSIHDNSLSTTSGAVRVAHWTTDEEPLVACKGNVVALNFFPPSSDVGGPFYWNSATDGVRLMTNALGAPCVQTITVVKHLVPEYDSGRFNLRIDGTTRAANVGNLGTTGKITVSTGTHSVSETAGTNALLSRYSTRISCSNGASGLGTSLSIVVNGGDDIVCTITNTRKLIKT
jgi:hypothetical protein